MRVPDCFVWTKFGTEAGQSIVEILRRKEDERKANEGVFYWGIGNAIGPSVVELLRRLNSPDVLFSPIKSAPRRQDVAPESVVAWTTAFGLDGEPYALPPRSLVTSRFNADRQRHYALVCRSDTPFEELITPSSRLDKVQLSELRNILSGRPLGGSQVTAVVMRESLNSVRGPEYDISFKATLVPPYLIHLSDPRPITNYDARTPSPTRRHKPS
jgi:hypothetical protein